MIIAPNGVSWQPTVHQPQRVTDEQAVAQAAQLRAPVATGNAAAQQHNQSNTSQQKAEDAREEAFAKLKVAMQNPEVPARQQASADTQTTSNALQDFRDFMAKSPGELIKEKLLLEMGLTEEEYNALPPEARAKVDELIAQRMKEDIERKLHAKVEEQLTQQQATASNEEQAAS
ncbi:MULTISPECIES: hypothetical protein [unclassified Pseudomonas]|jgi:hypothetical protein|uniref:hypothetical protein n=1 Tax=unclassified Pseudomonas TaxID=196821 RepID=UPI000A0A1BDC|nr:MULTISPECIES: hypothetical protein [unclassified Pseudomonas]SMF02558.1 hypothetical protein SAMN02745962_01094 [Pseudomonas sp. LAIL14HWK12:I11]SMR72413.1 hypothetical protein SAMN05661028_01095 [Pseudomonas sp. LAIL14HWK12:I10]SOD01325.1 hypothetical protein SAMN05660296_01095 [Pseudomonas sp. LAIL14HWK12:I8]